MPPIRSYPALKPMKTERSHEENQERAYIAASRRSDRSLEARIESARRASEIHKRRTGRSLRVTEADVVNEEMYEEEDDDLPFKYRRLTAHLNGNASDFNRRLAAFLTNQVAMRSALDQAMTANSSQQQQRQWDPTSQSLPPTTLQWLQSQQQSGSQPQFMPPIVSPGSLQRSPAVDFQRVSYPSPGSGKHNPSSACNPQSTLKSQRETHHRRSSDPHHAQPAVLSSQRSNSDSLLDGADQQNTTLPSQQYGDSLPKSASPQQQSFGHTGLSTNLPPEAQMFFSAPFDMAEFNGRPSSRSEKQPSYHYDAPKSTHNGMNQTLAPSALDDTQNPAGWRDTPSHAFDFGCNYDHIFSETPSGQATPKFLEGQTTPGDDFAAFIDSSAFEETPA